MWGSVAAAKETRIHNPDVFLFAPKAPTSQDLCVFLLLVKNCVPPTPGLLVIKQTIMK